MLIEFDRITGAYLSCAKGFLWVTKVRGTWPGLEHPKGKSWGFWREDGETILNAGPIVAALGRHRAAN